MAWPGEPVTRASSPIDSMTGLPADDLAVGLRMLADLLAAGLPVGRALTAFHELAPGTWQEGLPSIRAAVREGTGLAGALEAAPLGIPPLVVGMARAGEAGTGLAVAMAHAAAWAEHRAATRHAVRRALAYPALVAVTGLGAMSVMVAVVLPRFGAILAGLGQSLPPTTRFVLATATTARSLALPAMISLVAVALLAQRHMESASGRRALHRRLLALPGVGPVREANATARFSAALGALLESGVPVRHGIVHAARATDDAEIEARALRARDRIAAGDSVSRALRELRVVTPLAYRLVAAGEATGRLAPMLAFAARMEEQRAERLTRGAIQLIEPTLVLAIAAAVGFVAAAMLQAVYAVRPT